MAGEGNPTGYAITIATGGVGTAGSNSVGMSNLGNTSGTSGAASGAPIRYIFAGGNNITLSQSVAGGSGTLTISAFNQTVQTQNFFAGTISGNTSGVLAGISSGTLTLAGGNNITLSQAGNAVTISAFTESQSAGVSNLGNTAGTSGIASGSNVRFLLAGGNNVTLSQSVNGASATVSVAAGGTLGMYTPYWGSWGTAQYGNASVYVYPIFIPEFVTATRANFYISNAVSTSSNSSWAAVLSVQMAIYSLNASTLSSLSSGSTNFQFSNTSDASLSSVNAMRAASIPINVSATPGNYWVGFWSRTSSTNANWITMSNVIFLNTMNLVGDMAATINASNQMMPGFGILSVTSASIPGAIAISDIAGTISGNRLVPVMNMLSFTV